MKIGLFTSVYFNNIGNGFIDLGAEETLKAALITPPLNKEVEIIKLSQCANFAASLGLSFMVKENVLVRWLWEHIVQHFEKKIHDHTYDAISTLDVFSPMKIARLDYIILPGCILTDAFFTIYGKLLKEKAEQGSKLIFLGASGNYYTDKEVRIVTQWLETLKPYAIMFRDSVAYGHYASLTEHAYNGIDNVFFVNRLNIPRTATTIDPYAVINFDIPKHKTYTKALVEQLQGKHIVYTDHKPYPYIKVSRLAKQDVMCSDYPMDYLFIYRNAAEVHSDRVHACIPTLSFGNRAQLYSDSPRIALFENVGIDVNEMKDHPVSIDMNLLNRKEEEQIAYLASLLC